MLAFNNSNLNIVAQSGAPKFNSTMSISFENNTGQKSTRGKRKNIPIFIAAGVVILAAIFIR